MDRLSSYSKQKEHHHKLTPQQQAQMEAYEGLDFEHCENELFREWRKHEGHATTRQRHVWKWFLYMCIGIGTGTTAFLSAVLVDVFQGFRYSITLSLLDSNSIVAAYLANAFFCCTFVGIAAFFVVFVEPAAAGSGIPEAKAYLNGSNIPRYLSLKALFAKAVGVSFAVAGGLCVGKEGPLVHVGSAFAANLSHGSLRVSSVFLKLRNDPDKRDFVSGEGEGVDGAGGTALHPWLLHAVARGACPPDDAPAISPCPALN
jgi:chloride channel 7